MGDIPPTNKIDPFEKKKAELDEKILAREQEWAELGIDPTGFAVPPHFVAIKFGAIFAVLMERLNISENEMECYIKEAALKWMDESQPLAEETIKQARAARILEGIHRHDLPVDGDGLPGIG